ncbi:four helix bundle protein [Chryseobacterium sp.]|uniref:four helix bundle protein n=1 Tax=Chryseobacterium sp. TaxID=1871047 RepID=UPI0025B82699|nr:four helix bundle protein [Chryseobacterium sp.]
MMTKNFENFPVYLKSLDVIEKVYRFLQAKSFEKEFEFNNPIKRASFSVSNNIRRLGI